jgi:hypothetical protein
MKRNTEAGSVVLSVLFLLFSSLIAQRTAATAPASARLGMQAAQSASSPDTSKWKHYVSSEYGFDIAYPADWEYDSAYYHNYGKTPSGNRPAEYAGETRNLFTLEMDGPTQSHEGGGSFDDGVVVAVRITGTGGIVEEWGLRPKQPWYLITSTPAEWVKRESSLFGGDIVETVPVNTNDFSGAIQLACTGRNPCTPFGEGGAAYRVLPSGRVLLVGWERQNGANTFSNQRYLLPMLASFKLLK